MNENIKRYQKEKLLKTAERWGVDPIKTARILLDVNHVTAFWSGDHTEDFLMEFVEVTATGEGNEK